MPFQLADRKSTLLVILFSLALGFVFAFGLQPLAKPLSKLFFDSEQLGLVAIAFAFAASLPSRSIHLPVSIGLKRLILMGILPLVISFVFGCFKTQYDFNLLSMVWTWVTIPVVEELLFRGWIFNLLSRMTPNTYLNTLPLLPAALWGQTIAFSIWHLQNWNTLTPGILLFQVFYTFFVGLWLGFYRWQTGHIWLGLIAHSLLNFFADWKLWLVI